MILSPYTLLFLCVVHSPHSFAHYTLHKRMEVVEGVEASARLAKTTSEVGRPSVPTAVNTAVALTKPQSTADALKDATEFLPKEIQPQGDLPPHTTSSEHPVHLDAHNPAFHPPELDPSLHPPPIEPPKLTAIFRIKHKFASGWKNISLSFRRFTNVFSRSSAPRTFSYAPKLAADFRGIPQDSEQIKTLVSDLLEQLVNKKSAKSYQSYVRANPVLDKIPEITQETTDYLSQIQKFIAHDMPKNEEEISRSSEQIALKLAPALKDSANPSTASLGNLALQLARFNSHELLEARIGIRLYGGQRVESLANMHGFLGPQNVFSSQMASILRDESIVGKLPEGFNSDRFVKELEELQTHLTELARYQSAARQAARHISHCPHSPTTRSPSSKNSKKTKPRFSMEIAKAFKHSSQNRESRALPSFPKRSKLVFALSGQSRELALDNTVKRMAMAVKARELSQKMSSLYTNKGLDLIAQTIRTHPS
ncbi:uncharacterized protein PGTG_07147 [Puccinia graminis f. sp. tritici CRL 75-36-700-3]|uniref:Uncharacterized protein n=1 Tax=Puccinia graminis f. sp. tritici (strain CRL 75-36-700-3 / race SCCL) TaxID=418459 RepID=E3K9H0_PUCGT|nr:uncharacterized protein PGTG_07147 [Puccinia graminis f. sp. tritici CRL 75-36-700-3]EFP80895.1 hypothetical protein PGTG_07147 [Puccinia graminis f. sp. tritici CRL 75-36-700-3]